MGTIGNRIGNGILCGFLLSPPVKNGSLLIENLTTTQCSQWQSSAKTFFVEVWFDIIGQMNATNSALFAKLIESLKPLQNLNTPWFTKPETWLSLFAPLVALFLGGGGGRYIKPYLGIKPNLHVAGLRKFGQDRQDVWRIAIENLGTETAKDVQVDVTKIIDNGAPRENFLSMPLTWTHLGCESRDILPKQTVYLDLFQHHIPNQFETTVNLVTRFGGGINDFRELQQGKTKLELRFYYRGGKVSKEIEVNWKDFILDCPIVMDKSGI